MTMMGMSLRSSVAVMIMKSMLTSVTIVIVGVLLAGHLFVVGIVFLVAVAAVARVVTGTMSRTMRVVAVPIGVVFSVTRVRVVALIGPGLVAVLIVQSVIA